MVFRVRTKQKRELVTIVYTRTKLMGHYQSRGIICSKKDTDELVNYSYMMGMYAKDTMINPEEASVWHIITG